ncbi:MAG TPA: cytochrome C oxidase subunit IV family protein [Gemmatimonadota bacterium]|nr:cytochrome C oxidase subunit IV family protein [Gemmatimonadota bacterium]
MAEPTAETAREGGATREGAGAQESGAGHASKATYWMVALILGIITMLEVAVFYVPALRAVIVPALLALSAAKFILVAMFFMHLKYDVPVLTVLFSGALVVAAAIVLALMVLFGG